MDLNVLKNKKRFNDLFVILITIILSLTIYYNFNCLFLELYFNSLKIYRKTKFILAMKFLTVIILSKKYAYILRKYIFYS